MKQRIRKVQQPREVPKAEPVVLQEPSTDTIGGVPVSNIPKDWNKGMLLNVRNHGEFYMVSLYPEEYDSRSPERTLRFANPALCQDFVSNWYQRENSSPLAR